MKGNGEVIEASAEMPKVSVVMVAYNSSPYIGQAIAGVVNQRCDFGVQLVICDDASTDSTAEIVAEWKKRYPHIIDYHRNARNLGVQGNYLEALRHCRGEYIAMCDADDYWCCRTKLARQVRYMDSHRECVLTYHRVINYYEATGEMSLSNGGGAVETTPEGLSQRNTITNLSVLYRASAVDKEHLPSWLGEVRLFDYGLHILVASKGSIHYMARPMGVYRHLPCAIWSEADRRKRMEMAIAVRRHLIEQLKDRPELTSGLENACRAMITASQKPQAQNQKRKLISRMRGLVSRLLPVPKP